MKQWPFEILRDCRPRRKRRGRPKKHPEWVGSLNDAKSITEGKELTDYLIERELEDLICGEGFLV